MVRNESVANIFMFLCFGTAILSLGVHWRMKITPAQFEQPANAAGRQVERDQRGLTKTAGAAPSTAPVQPTQPSPIERISLPKKLAKVNAATELLPKMRSVLPGQRQNSQAFSSQTSSETEVVVNLSDRRTYVYKGGEVIASYPVAIGKEGWETPTGSFRVKGMQHYPIWQHPITGKVFPSGADSPLGERWIGFWSDGRNQIGFHGTPDTHLLGAAISHGCLRMRNDDVRLLYDQVKVGTLVSVRE
ncbi:L,D-transpeptidase [Nodularia harveyana UHCC-0300]|uniref:L,D-transpeptidase n=1 Tax=Nodularia harveyana UHCC-0300 TaxID=2974287 RepID=A0ABU5UHX8_9CYAN|nr:L,D-transpeptidase [Nodularia harveyana]MEA5583084.1 L,D-transpeptidase [Nodularia harveyana UHCC-0300]